ncbi:hypothetical protein CK203_018533 [Vitis vinifera]|uniref:Uncharacterized protein n=1 Tax=Vitis vinifera TaxID=29760 RepID=A0A438J638_VITVI|nr:hypothetical protein CK203_018533 [Vitis vinifera]
MQCPRPCLHDQRRLVQPLLRRRFPHTMRGNNKGSIGSKECYSDGHPSTHPPGIQRQGVGREAGLQCHGLRKSNFDTAWRFTTTRSRTFRPPWPTSRVETKAPLKATSRQFCLTLSHVTMLSRKVPTIHKLGQTNKVMSKLGSNCLALADEVHF